MFPYHKCSSHGGKIYILTTPSLGVALTDHKLEGITPEKLKIFYYSEREKHWIWQEYWADRAYLSNFIPNYSDGEVALVDRDRKNKKLNDRLLIQKIMSGMKNTYVCPACLADTVQQIQLSNDRISGE